jgi:energy-coupling factor transporter ATP-binding protein EcfA2
MLKPVDATNQLIFTALKAEQTGEGRWLGLCPAHNDKHPSLVIYENAEGSLGFHCNSRHCSTQDIVRAIKAQFDITVPSKHRPGGIEGGKVQKLVNYPSHISTLPLKYRKANDILYEYHTAQGEVAFIVHRFVDNNGKKQTPAYFSKKYISEEGIEQNDWDIVDPPQTGRPLYNLYELEHFPKKPVLIVEGEKTADAGKHLLPDYIVTTWSGGSSNIKCTDWSPLKHRQTSIYLWPDNDTPGLKSMREIAAKLSEGLDDTRFFMLDYNLIGVHPVPDKWDIADEFAEPWSREGNGNPYSLEEMLHGFKLYHSEEILEVGTLDEEMSRRDKTYRKFNQDGKVIILDISKRDDRSYYGYNYYNDVSSLCAMDTAKVWTDEEKPKTIPLARYWYFDHPTSKLLTGTSFVPSSKDIEVYEDGQYRLNTFLGFPNFKSFDVDDLRLVNFMEEHLSKLLEEPLLRDWILDWMAHIFQHPTRKPGTAIVFVGPEGTGKSSILNVMTRVLGNRLSKIADEGIQKWSGSLDHSLLITQDELELNHYEPKNKAYYNYLINFITSPRIVVKEKHVKEKTIDSYHRIAFTSNDMSKIHLRPTERRLVIAKATMYWYKNKAHFDQLYYLLSEDSACAGFQKWLISRNITSILNEAPMSEAKQEMIYLANELIEEVRKWYEDGALPEYIAKHFPDAHLFGRIAIRLHQTTFVEAYEHKKGISKLQTEERKFLTEHFMEHYFAMDNRVNKKVRQTMHYSKLSKLSNGSVEIIPGKAYTFWPIAEGRAAIEKAVGGVIPWRSPEDMGYAAEALTDEENKVVKLATKDIM